MFLLKGIAEENFRLQSFRHKFEALREQTTNQLSSFSLFYQKRKEDFTFQGEEWFKQIDKTVKKLHQELDEIKKENESKLKKQHEKLEEIIEKMGEINWKSTKLERSKNVMEMQKFRSVIIEPKTMKEFTLYTFPTVH